MKIYTKIISSCYECPNFTPVRDFCSEVEIQNTNEDLYKTIFSKCPLPELTIIGE